MAKVHPLLTPRGDMSADAVSSEPTIPPPDTSEPLVAASEKLVAASDKAEGIPLAEALDAELLLNGLGVLADLLSEASETLNQCLLTIEDKLQAQPIIQEQWIPVRAALPPAGGLPRQPDQMQERIFGGVAVTILKLGPAESPDDTKPGEPRHEVGYAPFGGTWALVTRRVAEQAGDEAQPADQGHLQLLRDAELEFRLRAIREVPRLLKVLEVRRPEASAAAAPEAATSSGEDGTPADTPTGSAVEVDPEVRHAA